MASKIFLAFLLSLLVNSTVAKRYSESTERRQAQQCQLQRITTREPSQRIESEGGVTEIWNHEEDQFQCAGVAPMRNVIQPNRLSLPKFFPAPRLIYIEQGYRLGITYPGCPETYHLEQHFSRGFSQGGTRGDQHQKLHRVRRGDVIAVPAGAAHWCYNDGNQELVAVSVLDIDNEANQLDQNFRAFILAGGNPKQARPQHYQSTPPRYVESEMTEDPLQNVFRAFDKEMIAEAFNIPINIVRKMQQSSSSELIVKCEREIRIMTPDQEEQRERYDGMPKNGLEQTFCTMKIKHNIDIQREADVYTKQARKINIANEQKLPILRYIYMSPERGHLVPVKCHLHASLANVGPRIIYALRGELHVQIVDDNGNKMMDQRVKQGDMFVLPQFYASVSRAGREGFEWVTFKTCYTSVLRAMPIEVLTNAYQISRREPEQLPKINRDPQSMLLSPIRTSS
ncbi:hypothetical protein K2173_018436 [Erythroxylum novogranatense]|uniref:Cupin type-1 domain-containing protein n=1 Tax=Erythroxylum novogranatense TaxID=1862640 RepID=A0AAV8UDS1_9ROSI|nr:hypothetical protein K2173_018436 [Erythroxylum novogranatense]